MFRRYQKSLSISTIPKTNPIEFFPLNLGWISSGEVPEFKQFTDEPKAKRARRHKKYAKEALEANKIKKEMAAKNQNEDSLIQAIQKRQQNRESVIDNLINGLAKKYGGAEAKRSNKTSAKKTTKKDAINKVKSGRVSKKK